MARLFLLSYQTLLSLSVLFTSLTNLVRAQAVDDPVIISDVGNLADTYEDCEISVGATALCKIYLILHFCTKT